MWPLDVSICALVVLILYLIFTQLRFDDPRWLFNGWTYVVAIPLFALAIDLVLRRLASRYVQKSVQIGFLSSITVHLLLLIVAFQWVIFPHYFSETHTGVRSQPSPVKKTVPEYLFRTPDSPGEAADWSQPVEAAAPARSAADPARQLDPAQQSAPDVELPEPAEPEPPKPRERIERRDFAAAPPQPTSAAPASRRRQRRDTTPTVPLSEPANAPRVAASAAPPAEPTEIEREQPLRQRRSDRAPSRTAAPADLPERSQVPPAALAARPRRDAMPSVGDQGAAQRRRSAERSTPAPPAGAAPAAPSVAIDHRAADAERLLTPNDSPLPRRASTGGTELSREAIDRPLPPATESHESFAPDLASRAQTARRGMPEVATETPRTGARPRRRSTTGPLTPAGSPDVSPALAAAANDEERRPSRSEAAERSESAQWDRPRVSDTAGADRSGLGQQPLQEPLQSQRADAAHRPSRPAADSDELPSPAAMARQQQRRARRDVGGPPAPAGTDIAAVESFSRRVARTSGGAQPTPAGTVGPATEEAIERGLVWLAERQNADGSWSLQGHGEDVILTSDTAATGLSLLAFQGAGYTHRQHQYAGTVARGLEFLISSQRTNGDLYRRENPTSDRNVALYSHGIAALAMCEAYGMTQDPQLRDPAQAAIDYIAATQHHRRGGWRYTPQVSSDTSVTGWMMMALKSGELAGLEVPRDTYAGIDRWLRLAQQSPGNRDRYRYNPYAPDTPSQRHGRIPTPTMTSVGILMRMYLGWERENPAMQSAADYLLKHPPQIGTEQSPQRDTYYWYYATQVMFHMGGDHWDRWNRFLNPILLDAQIKRGPEAGSWNPEEPVPDRWGPHAGRLYVTTLNLLNLEIYYRHLPIYEKTLE